MGPKLTKRTTTRIEEFYEDDVCVSEDELFEEEDGRPTDGIGDEIEGDDEGEE
jgi:hypothetical protein